MSNEEPDLFGATTSHAIGSKRAHLLRLWRSYPRGITKQNIGDYERVLSWMQANDLGDAIDHIERTWTRQNGTPLPGDIISAHRKLSGKPLQDGKQQAPTKPPPLVTREFAEAEWQRMWNESPEAFEQDDQHTHPRTREGMQLVVDRIYVGALRKRINMHPAQEQRWQEQSDAWERHCAEQQREARR